MKQNKTKGFHSQQLEKKSHKIFRNKPDTKCARLFIPFHKYLLTRQWEYKGRRKKWQTHGTHPYRVDKVNWGKKL